MRLLIFVILGLSLASCVNQDLSKIELKSELEASVFTPETNITEETAVESGIATYTLPTRLSETGISSGNIQSVVVESITASLTEPADSTFSIFTQLDVFVKANGDSLQIASLSTETAQTTRTLSLRRIRESNLAPFVVTPDLASIVVLYQLNTTEVDTISMSLNANLMATGEID